MDRPLHNVKTTMLAMAIEPIRLELAADDIVPELFASDNVS